MTNDIGLGIANSSRSVASQCVTGAGYQDRFVIGNPILNSIHKSLEAGASVGYKVASIPILIKHSAISFEQSLREIPVIECNPRLNPLIDQLVNKAIIQPHPDHIFPQEAQSGTRPEKSGRLQHCSASISLSILSIDQRFKALLGVLPSRIFPGWRLNVS